MNAQERMFHENEFPPEERAFKCTQMINFGGKNTIFSTFIPFFRRLQAQNWIETV